MRPEGFSDSTLRLQVPNKFFQTWIKDHYLGLIKDAVKQATQRQDVNIELVVAAQELEPPPQKEKPKPRRWFFRPSKEPAQEGDGKKFNPRFSFETFVIGPSNRFAHAASLAEAESPARSYNPLFIYGGVG
ncbi:MAG: chromosomal replication initiator protein DnaA, partial [Candidatus Omnitrophota bacterium]